jgi:hypothetical protein
MRGEGLPLRKIALSTRKKASTWLRGAPGTKCRLSRPYRTALTRRPIGRLGFRRSLRRLLAVLPPLYQRPLGSRDFPPWEFAVLLKILVKANLHLSGRLIVSRCCLTIKGAKPAPRILSSPFKHTVAHLMRLRVAVLVALQFFGTNRHTLAWHPAQQQPPGAGIVCATKGGDQRTYWNEEDARRNGAQVLYAGECRSNDNFSGR